MRLLALLLFVLAARAAEPPNIVFLLADDLRASTLGCMGDPLIQTPHIDALAKRGTLFRQNFVTTSICCVSRASIFSGQYARRHGINDFKTGFTPAALAQTYPALLRTAGYRTGFIGKYGVGDKMPVAAFDYWRGFPGQGNFFTGKDPQHLTAKMGAQAIEFLRDADSKRPFCLSLSFKAPHAQDGAEREFPPDPRDEALYGAAQIPAPRLATDAFFKLLPPFAQASEGRARWERRFATPDMFQQTTRDYYRLVSGIDREVGRIIDTLRELGLAENTVVVFTSDNGWFMGERGMADKWLMYEDSIRVPLIIADPRQTARASIAMTLNIDLAPTLLDYAGISAPASMQGRSLRPLIRGESPEWRSEWFYEHLTLPKIIPPSEGVRTDRWKYLRWMSVEPAIEELYDLTADPIEARNLAAAPEHHATLEQLRARWSALGESLR